MGEEGRPLERKTRRKRRVLALALKTRKEPYGHPTLLYSCVDPTSSQRGHFGRGPLGDGALVAPGQGGVKHNSYRATSGAKPPIISAV